MLYVIFLGVVPMVVLSSIGVWYIRNSGQYWKKGMLSTYVSSLDRLKEKRKPHVFSSKHIRGPKSSHMIGKSFYEGVTILFAPRETNARNRNRVFTISDNLPPKEKLQITKADLISTTNPDAINCSSSIEYAKPGSFGNSTENVNSNKSAAESDQPNDPIVAEPQPKRINSIKSELSSKISERIQQMQKKPSKNIKGLTVKTDVKFEHLNESPNVPPSVSPKFGNKLPAKKPATHDPAPFYNKKPPPPPAPAQSLKPKI